MSGHFYAEDATIGANGDYLVCGITIGRYAFVAARRGRSHGMFLIMP